jgi:hypothetical protein
MQLYTRGGVQLADITNLHKYLNLVQKVEMKNERLANRSVVNFLYPNNSLTNVPPALRPSTSVPATVANSTKAYVEPAYALVGGDNTATPTTLFQLNLGDIPHTIFSLDKDLLFNEVLVLRIEWASGSSYAWYSALATNPANGSAAVVSNITISRLSFYLAIETDEMIIQSLRNKVNSDGLSVLIPFIWGFKNPINTSTSHNISLRFNSAHGLSLCKVFSAPYNATETTHLAFDHSNENGSKITNYYTMIDNARLTDFDIRCTDADPIDYMFHKDILRGTPLEDQNIYRYNFFHCDDFCKSHEIADDPNVVNGIPLTQREVKWDIQATAPANNTYNWYTFCVLQRMLKITSGMVTLN